MKILTGILQEKMNNEQHVITKHFNLVPKSIKEYIPSTVIVSVRSMVETETYQLENKDLLSEIEQACLDHKKRLQYTKNDLKKKNVHRRKAALKELDLPQDFEDCYTNFQQRIYDYKDPKPVSHSFLFLETITALTEKYSDDDSKSICIHIDDTVPISLITRQGEFAVSTTATMEQLLGNNYKYTGSISSIISSDWIDPKEIDNTVMYKYILYGLILDEWLIQKKLLP